MASQVFGHYITVNTAKYGLLRVRICSTTNASRPASLAEGDDGVARIKLGLAVISRSDRRYRAGVLPRYVRAMWLMLHQDGQMIRHRHGVSHSVAARRSRLRHVGLDCSSTSHRSRRFSVGRRDQLIGELPGESPALWEPRVTFEASSHDGVLPIRARPQGKKKKTLRSPR